MTTDVLLAEVVQQRDLSEVEARALVDGIRRDGMGVVERTAIAYKGRAWIALGYASWDAMREVEFSDARLGIPREERAEQVLSLRAAGMSTREIGKSLGVDKDTVSRDLARVPNGDTSPATITDSLGRQQPASKPRPQPSPPPVMGPAHEAAPGGGEPYVPDLNAVNLSKDAYVAKLAALGQTVPVEQKPDPSPLAAARAEVAKQPAMLAAKAVERLRTARLTFEAAGTAAEIVADLVNDGLADGDQGDDWLPEIDAALEVLGLLASALRRRNLRSIKP